MVWTEITRPKYRRDELRYASDTTDEEWAVIAPYMPGVNAFLKILLNGGAKIEVYSAHNHEGPYARRRG
jgi:hypothetical protein